MEEPISQGKIFLQKGKIHMEDPNKEGSLDKPIMEEG